MKLLFLLSFAACAQGQTVFHFTSQVTPRDLQETATIIRTVADIPQLTILDSEQSIRFQGPAAQVSMAQWILTQIDTQGNGSAMLQYTSPAGDDVVHVNFLPNVATPQQQQELLTVLRTVADIAKVFNYSGRQALVLRASSIDMAFAQWMIDQLNLPSNANLDATPRVYTGQIKSYGPLAKIGETARVNYLAPGTTMQGMQQILTALRLIGIVQKVFVYSNLHAVVLRGPESEIDRSEWLIQQLNQSGPNAGAQLYRTPNADDVTQIFFLSNATPQALQSAANALKSEAGVPKVCALSQPSALVARGTSDQIAAAVQFLAQHNGLAE